MDTKQIIETIAEGLAAYDGQEISKEHRSLSRHLAGWLILHGLRIESNDE